MTEAIRDRLQRWKVQETLLRHSGLRIVPSRSEDLFLAGSLAFVCQGPRQGPIADEYEVELVIPPEFPSQLPQVRETGGRIPGDFHKLQDGSLCLAAPTELRLRLSLYPTISALIDDFVIPYLFGYSFYSQFGEMPFGELAHGKEGILQQLADLFGVKASERLPEFLTLAGRKKRIANKRGCPCGSGRRLGRCHNRTVNHLRDQLGRRWFRDEAERVSLQVGGAKMSVR